MKKELLDIWKTFWEAKGLFFVGAIIPVITLFMLRTLEVGAIYFIALLFLCVGSGALLVAMHYDTKAQTYREIQELMKKGRNDGAVLQKIRDLSTLGRCRDLPVALSAAHAVFRLGSRELAVLVHACSGFFRRALWI